MIKKSVRWVTLLFSFTSSQNKIAMSEYLSDLEIARRAVLQPIEKIAAKLGINNNFIDPYGRYKAKISLSAVDSVEKSSYGKLILVTAVTPTPAGEGKTTTSIGLADALNRIGKKTTVCLREPSLGPCFGIKGGAAGGGYAQVVPMEEINLHFTGDFHAITSAHDLLAAVLDNQLHHGNALGIDPRRIVWGRVLDLNDRALRHIVVGLGGTANSVPHESSFDITVASEVMAIFCLSESVFDLKEKLGRIIVAYAYDGKPVTASDLKCHGAMAALLKDAIHPNLVQTLEGNPAIVHGGPFANIAHGCNSVAATKTALKLSEYVVTEAGFGADLGAEKFLDIKCRKTGLSPSAVAIVATVRALKYHGGIELADLKTSNTSAVETGFANLGKHIENMRQFGLPVVVAINVFPTDTDEEIRAIERLCRQHGVRGALAEHWAKGGAGAENLAKLVVETVEKEQADFKPIYDDDMPLLQKIETVAQKIYGADGVAADKKVLTKLKQFETLGFGDFPICIAKTQYSFSADPGLRGRPAGFNIPVRDVKISAGAGFVVVLAGEVMTMPGLPKSPAAERIDIDEHGEIVGLF
ncbi:MAG: formate--tetrahydrofolate ligase [Planctomycetaceae bacterium]|jgi:formate--tetrahydrofolate ligase|nr:formate--tetrahydrofolate ligase [Planctomycetaceae bacterium]